MKAMQLTDYDQPLVLRDIPVPTAEAGQVTVKIHTCGLNFGDLLIIKGTYQERPQLPFTQLSAHIFPVTEVGAGVTDFRVDINRINILELALIDLLIIIITRIH